MMRRAVVVIVVLAALLLVGVVFAMFLGHWATGPWLFDSPDPLAPEPTAEWDDAGPLSPRVRVPPDAPAPRGRPVEPPPLPAPPDSAAILFVDVVRVDGTPVGGARVDVQPWAAMIAFAERSVAAWTATTDGSGRARLEIPPPQYVGVRAEDGGAASFPVVVNLPASSETTRTIVIAPAISLSGVVFDPSGRRVPGASITLSTVGADGAWLRLDGHAGKEGQFVLPPLPTRALASVVISAFVVPPRPNEVNVMATTSFRFARDELERQPYLELRLRSETIRGRCIDVAGAAVSDAWIRMAENERPRTKTDAEGRFSFKGAPPPGAQIIVMHGEFVPQRIPLPALQGGAAEGGAAEAGAVKRGAATQTGVRDLGDIVLDRGEPISGVVVRADGTPVERAFVTLHADGLGGVYGRRVSDADGRFTFAHARPGAHTIRARAPTGRPCLPFDVEVQTEPGSTSMQVVLPRISWVHLRLVDASGERVRVARSKVRVVRSGESEPVVAGTVWMGGSDLDSGFVQLPGAGHYDIEVDAPGCEPASRLGVAIGAFDAAQTTVEITVLRTSR